MHSLIPILLIIASNLVFSQTKITWKTLSDVKFEEKVSNEDGLYYFYPSFGANVKKVEGELVLITGYALAIDPENGFYVLSKTPFSSCFFCGAGGPETIVELELKSDENSFVMDQIITIEGVLKLNEYDINQCNYILKQAEVYGK